MSGESLDHASGERLPGFFGKVPSHGDFVSRRLPGSFLDCWDVWLQESVSQSRGQLEDQWLDYYLTSPLWHFALSSGVCGDSGWAGVLMPSVDRVGRYFPLTLGARFDPHRCPVDAIASYTGWYGELERLALPCLEEEFDLEAFDEGLKALGPPLADVPDSAAERDSPSLHGEGGKAWRFGVSVVATPAAVCAQLLRHSLNAFLTRYSLWWSEGSSQVQPSVLVCEGLPPAAGYSALLDGAWMARGWQDQGTDDVLATTADAVPADTAPPGDAPPGDAAPGDAAPGDTAPADAAPGDAAPGDDTVT